MEMTKASVALIVASCLTAGAAGGYLAMREEGPSPSPAPSIAPHSDLAAGESVEHSEAFVPDDVPAPAPVEAAARPVSIAVRPAASRAPRPERAAPVPSAPALAQEAPAPIAEVPPLLPAPIEPVVPVAIEPDRTPEPPAPDLQELVLAGDSVIGLLVESALSSETARVEDEVVARVTRDVKVGDHVAIPAGSMARGEVTLVERGGKLRERSRLGVRFTSIVLVDGVTHVPITAEPIYREGDAPGRESTTKIGGGAIGGAIIGGILGGAKGAAIGGSIGAGAGSAAVLAGGRNPATLSPGSPVTIRLRDPATVVVER